MRFKTLFLIVVLILAEALLLRLGYWQYGRMLEKEAEKQEFMTTLDARTKTYDGVFDHNREVVLESQQKGNEYGYRILTPLLTENAEVIVDRGWVRRSFRPDFLDAYKTTGPVTVTGVERTPPALKQTFLMGPIEGAGAEGVRVLKVLKLDEIPEAEAYRRQKDYLQATSQTHPNVDAFFVPPKGGAKHKEYMLTWWSLAVIFPLLALGAFRRRRKA